MITPPTAPSPGKPVSASFFARLISWVKSGQLIEGPNYRLHRTPNGTSLEIAVNAKSKASVRPDGRFEIHLKLQENEEGSDEEDRKYTATFKNPYYDIGGKTYKLNPEEGEEEVAIADVRDGNIICLKIETNGDQPVTSLYLANDMNLLQVAQSNIKNIVIPLYEINNGSVSCDFRIGPTPVIGEF